MRLLDAVRIFGISGGFACLFCLFFTLLGGDRNAGYMLINLNYYGEMTWDILLVGLTAVCLAVTWWNDVFLGRYQIG